MRRTRIHTSETLKTGARLQLDANASRHIRQVLRLKPGDKIALFDGSGRDFEAQITELAREAVTVCIDAAGPEEPQPPLDIHLGIGVSKGERMDFALQKAVELGVGQMTPLFTERSVVRLQPDRLAKRMQHWRGVVIAACEQSGRRRIPKVQEAQSLAQWLHQNNTSAGLLLDHRAELALTDWQPPNATTHGEAAQADRAAAGRESVTTIALLIGPEGGLSPLEREEAKASGWTAMRLGPRVLRTETAPLAAIAVLQALWGDFRD